MEQLNDNVHDLRLKVPSTLTIFGASKSGKTNLVIQMIKNLAKVYDKPINKIVFLYSIWQSAYEDIKSDVVFVTDADDIDAHIDKDYNSLVVFDDQILNIQKNNKQLESFYVQKAHHLNCAVVFLCQNIYAKNIRLASVNSDFVIIFNFPRDYSMVNSYFRQMDSSISKDLFNVYREIVTSGPYKYIVLAFHPSVDQSLRIRDSIFPSKDLVVYRPRQNGQNFKPF